MGKIGTGSRFFLVLAAAATGQMAASQNIPPSEPAPATAPVPAPPPAVTPPAPAVTAATQAPETPLPPIPAAPQAALPEYPNCRSEHDAIRGRVAKATRVRSCITRLDQYNLDILQVVANRMNVHRNGLMELWNRVNNGSDFSHSQKTEFYGRISVEFANSQPEGSHMDQFRLTYGRYVADREYLRTEYCNLITCTRQP